MRPFAISKYLVTWAQYRSFLEADAGYREQHWWRGLAERAARPGEQYRKQDNHPAENVSWYDAVAFCRWLSARLGYEVRLPTEWEWQQATTGSDPAREHPWGADWDPAYSWTTDAIAHSCNLYELYVGLGVPAGSFYNVPGPFMWDEDKCLTNIQKHGGDFLGSRRYLMATLLRRKMLAALG